MWLSAGALGERDEEAESEPPADLQVPLAGRTLQFAGTGGTGGRPRGPIVRDISMAALVIVEVEGEEEDVHVALDGAELAQFGSAFGS